MTPAGESDVSARETVRNWWRQAAAYALVLATALALAGAVTLVHGYAFGISDHNEQLPLIYRFQDSDYLRNDWYVNVNTGFGPRTFYVAALAAIGKVVPLAILFFLLYATAAVALVAGLILLARWAGLSYAASVLGAVVALLAARTTIGENWALPPLLVPSTIATPLVVWTMVALSRRAWIAAALLLAATAYVHPVISAHGVVVALALGVAIRDLRGSTARMLILYAALAAPGFVSTLFFEEDALSTSEYVQIVAFERHPWHYIISQFPAAEHVQFVSFLGIAGPAAAHGLIVARTAYARFVVVFSLAFVAPLLLAGMLFVEVWPVKALMLLQLPRLTVLMNLLFSVLVAGWIVHLMRSGATRWLGATLIVLLVGSSLYPGLLRGAGLLAGGYGLIACMRLIPVAAPRRRLALVAGGALLLLTTAVTVVGAGGVLASIANDRASRPGLRIHMLERPRVDDVAQYIRTNTPSEAVLLVPPYTEEFRLRSNRAIVIDFKAFPFGERAVFEWNQRMSAVSGGTPGSDEFRAGWAALGEVELLAIACEYRASYIVLERERPTDWPPLLSGQSFNLYEARCPPAQDRPR